MNKDKVSNISISELFGTKKGIGSAVFKGLTEEPTEEQLETIIEADKNKVYMEIDEELLEEYEHHEYGNNRGDMKSLAQSIEKYGVIQPVIVRKKGNKYEILAGHRRTEASRMVGKKTIPCIVINIEDDSTAKMYVHITNQLQTNIEDLPPSRKARVITDFYDEIIRLNKEGSLDNFLEVEELKKSNRTDEITAEKFNTSTKKIEKLRRIDKNLINPLKMLLDLEWEEKRKNSSYKCKLPEGSAEYIAYLPSEWQDSINNAIIDEEYNMVIKLNIAKEIYASYKEGMSLADLDNFLFNGIPFHYEEDTNEKEKSNYNVKIKLSQESFEKYFSKDDTEADKVNRTIRALEVLDYCERNNIDIPF